MKAPFLIGRAMLGGFFIYNGIHHFQEAEMMAGYAKSKKLPLPKAAVIGTGVAMVAGGASLVTGIKPKWGSAALIAFLGSTAGLGTISGTPRIRSRSRTTSTSRRTWRSPGRRWRWRESTSHGEQACRSCSQR